VQWQWVGLGVGASVGCGVGVGSGLCDARAVGQGVGVSVQLPGNGVTPRPPEDPRYPIGSGLLPPPVQEASKAMPPRKIVAVRRRIMDVAAILEQCGQQTAERMGLPGSRRCQTRRQDPRCYTPLSLK
jgi:hypothetical protein